MVGRDGGRVSSRSRSRFSKKFILALQRMDVGRARVGLDQHENYSRYGLLYYRDSHWNVQTMAGKRSHGATFETRPRQLSRYPQAPTRFPSNAPVLISKR